MKKLVIIVAMCCTCLSAPTVEAFAQLYYRTTLLSTRDGLSDNDVTCFYKDRRGFMWIGTRNGLNRYDGHEFRIFRPGLYNSISNEVINAVAEDEEGHIWVATMEGLNKLDPVSLLWQTLLPSGKKEQKGLPNFIVWDLVWGKDHRLWIASDVFELSVLDVKTGQYTYYDWPGFARQDKQLKQYSYRSIQKLVPGSGQTYWLGTTCGLVKLDAATGNFTYVGGRYSANVVELKYDSVLHKVFLTIENGKAYVYDELKNQFSELNPEPMPYPSRFYHLPQAKDIWIGSAQGVIEVSRATGHAWLYRDLPRRSGMPQPGHVRQVLVEQPGLFWIATANGVLKSETSSSSPSFLPLVKVEDDALPNQMGGVIWDEPSSSYFVCAGDQNEVFRITPATGKLVSIKKDLNGSTFSACHSLSIDRQGQLWLLTTRDVFRYDRSREGFVREPIPHVNGEEFFRDLVEDYEGNYWAAAYKGGLFLKPKGSHQWVVLDTGEFAYTRKVMALCADSARQAVWIGTFSEGLFRYDLKSRRLAHIDLAEVASVSASHALVHDIHLDREGQLWVATHSGGLYRWSDKPGGKAEVRRFSMREGIPGNNCLALANGAGNSIWVLSGQQLFSLTLDGKPVNDPGGKIGFPFTRFLSDEKLPHGMFYNTKDEQLAVAVAGGLLLQPAVQVPSVQPYPLVITRLVTGRGERKDTVESPSGQISLAFAQNAISFSFAGLSYSLNQNLHYQYQLQGYDDGWVPASVNRSVAFQNLEPGHYVFRVRALNNRNQQVAVSTPLSFEVVPPFWRRWWFVGIIILVLAAGVMAWINVLRQRIKSQKLLTYFATSLYGQNTVEDIYWDIAKNCISELRFQDCVIYGYDEERQMLVQRAAYGPKNPDTHTIFNPIEIPLGAGIVGSVAATLRPEIVSDTSKDSRYIVDDCKRLSEIAVPIVVDNKLFGVIDSEHPRKGFYNQRHLKLLTQIAGISATKISKFLIEERLRMKIARDLHDEMGSTLTGINIISKLAMEHAAGNELLLEQLQKIKDHSGQIMDAMSDIIWAINPYNDSLEKLVLRMKEQAAEMMDPAGLQYDFLDEASMYPVLLNPEQRKEIFLIFKEAIHNAVKYSHGQKVKVVLRLQQRELYLSVMDDGIGFTLSEKTGGNGLRNMKSRAAQLNAMINMHTSPGKGTAIELRVPVT